jgi:hypothetical protein
MFAHDLMRQEIFDAHQRFCWPRFVRLNANFNKRPNMFFSNPCEHNGFVITGNAFELASGRWQSQLLVERAGFVPHGMGISPICIGARAAEQQALLAARRVVEGAGFTLRTAAESA